jgi:hypothetical protein
MKYVAAHTLESIFDTFGKCFGHFGKYFGHFQSNFRFTETDLEKENKILA